MKTIQIRLDLNEAEYGQALARSLMGVNSYFSIGCRPEEPYDLILTDEPSISADKLVYFTDERNEETIDEERKVFVVYKYQHVRSISRILRLAHSVYSDGEPLSDAFEQVNLISVCSFAGGSGCTSVAMGLSLELARFHNKRVLYLSLEEFESTRLYFPDDIGGDQNITRYLYHILHGNQAGFPSPSGYLCQNEFDVSSFRPSRGRNPLRELDERQFVKFMNATLQNQLFTDVVMDCGNGIDVATLSAMALSRSICHVDGRSRDQGRRATYRQTAEDRIGMKKGIRWIEVRNFHEAFFDEETSDYLNQDQIRVAIPRAESNLTQIDGRIKIDMDKTFGQGISVLLSHIPLE